MSTATTPEAGTAPASSLLTRTGLVAGALVLALIVAAFVGAFVGVKLRPILGLEGRR